MDSRIYTILLMMTVLVWYADCDATTWTSRGDEATYRAAVYEHIPFVRLNRDIPLSRHRALELMQRNLNVYKQQAKKAKEQDAQIIVFPEIGLYGGNFTRKTIASFLEQIPDPKQIDWIPCSDPKRFHDTEVQHALSCMAQENGLYLVANMGDYVPCNSSVDPKCPPDGHYQYNTDVAYSPDGRLVAKYHKTHLFYEAQFDTPKPEVVYFDTPFGRFGMLVCFDLMFKKPAVTMVTQYNVTNIAFPTAWIDALPLLSALGYHSSFGRGLGVNLLAANIHLPFSRFYGSGIYTPEGMATFYYNNHGVSPGKLLVSTVNVIEPETAMRYRSNSFDSNVNMNTVGGGKHGYTETDTGNEFQAYLFDDLFTFQPLDKASGELNVCQKNVCCSLSYQFSDYDAGPKELFAFGVFDGLHTYQGQFYFQICTLVKCLDASNKSTCGSAVKDSATKFKSFSITGTFQTEFVYPQVILSSGGQLLLADSKSWSFHNATLTSGSSLDQPLLSAALLGRCYDRDDGKVSKSVKSGRPGNKATALAKEWKVLSILVVAAIMVMHFM